MPESEEYRKNMRDTLLVVQGALKELSGELRASDLAHAKSAAGAEYQKDTLVKHGNEIDSLKGKTVALETTVKNIQSLMNGDDADSKRITAMEEKIKELEKKLGSAEKALAVIDNSMPSLKAIDDRLKQEEKLSNIDKGSKKGSDKFKASINVWINTVVAIAAVLIAIISAILSRK